MILFSVPAASLPLFEFYACLLVGSQSTLCRFFLPLPISSHSCFPTLFLFKLPGGFFWFLSCVRLSHYLLICILVICFYFIKDCLFVVWWWLVGIPLSRILLYSLTYLHFLIWSMFFSVNCQLWSHYESNCWNYKSSVTFLKALFLDFPSFEKHLSFLNMYFIQLRGAWKQ